MSKLLEMFHQDFMLNVLAGTMIVAAICSYLGVFIVLRRAVFVGAALAQVSSLGVALALFAADSWPTRISRRNRWLLCSRSWPRH